MVTALVEHEATKGENPNIAPTLIVTGLLPVLDVFNLVAIPVERLGLAVASLADEDSRAKLVRAMDELLSQA